MPENFNVSYTSESGLTLSWAMPNGVALDNTPVRVDIHGHNVHYVWTVINCGEGAPAWAEKDLLLTAFGTPDESPGFEHELERAETAAGGVCYRAFATHERAKVALELRLEDGELRTRLSITNPQPLNGRSLPVCLTEMKLKDLNLGPNGQYTGAHAYGGWGFHHGRLAELTHEGIPFQHGCVGLGIPVVCLHDPDRGAGLQLEFMLNERPMMWVRPGDSRGCANWCITWTTDRLLEPGQTHAYGGHAGFAPYEGRPVQAMRRWRDNAGPKYGLVPPRAPDWIRRANTMWFNMSPGSNHLFSRLDDPKFYELMKQWKELGYTAIYGVAPNKIGPHICSPLDYKACDEVGGPEAEAQCLAWAHELGFHFFLWVTTVGINMDAPATRAHPEWFTHRPNGDLFCAWCPPPPEYQNSMPDGDPLSIGFRTWLKDEVTDLVRRGYDGIYIDGLCPRGDNHLRWSWPGEGRNSVEDQMRELAEHVRSLGDDLITFSEDCSLAAQATSECTQGRYNSTRPYLSKTPYMNKFGWFHGVIGGNQEVDPDPPGLIPFEMVRDYLLVRYASLLPGIPCEDCHDSYHKELQRPWAVQSLIAGQLPRTGSQYLDDPQRWAGGESDDVPEMTEQEIAARRRSNKEFSDLLKLCRDEPLIRDAAMSIEGVVVEGDAAVVGMIRPTPERCLLAVMQFADRPANVKLTLAPPDDAPAVYRASAGEPQQSEWTATEILNAITNDRPAPPARISGTTALDVQLSAYGFRVFELET